MQRAPFLFPLVVMLFLATGCATAVLSGAATGDNNRTGATAAADARITREVRTRLYRDERLADARIHVSTRQGVVTLSGRVNSAEAMNRAMAVAAGVAGVERVNVELHVKATP